MSRLAKRAPKPIRLSRSLIERLSAGRVEYLDAFSWRRTDAAKAAAGRLLRELDELATQLAGDRLARLLREARAQRLPGIEEVIKAAAEDADLAPWFRPAPISRQVRARMTVPAMKRWTRYVLEFGCLSCGGKAENGGLGFCVKCGARVRNRLRQIEKELAKEER